MSNMTVNTNVRRFADLVFDILTLLAITVSGVGHLGPWFHIYEDRGMRSTRQQRDADPRETAEEMAAVQQELSDIQLYYTSRSGAGLAGAVSLVFLALLFQPQRAIRKLQVLLLFVTLIGSVVFMVLPYSPFGEPLLRGEHPQVRILEDWGYLMAMVPAMIAAALTLIRMGWTMAPRFSTPESDASN